MLGLFFILQVADRSYREAVLQRSGLTALAVHPEFSLTAFLYDEGALAGEGVHLRFDETIQTSCITISGRYETVAFVGD